MSKRRRRFLCVYHYHRLCRNDTAASCVFTINIDYDKTTPPLLVCLPLPLVMSKRHRRFLCVYHYQRLCRNDAAASCVFTIFIGYVKTAPPLLVCLPLPLVMSNRRRHFLCVYNYHRTEIKPFALTCNTKYILHPIPENCVSYMYIVPNRV